MLPYEEKNGNFGYEMENFFTKIEKLPLFKGIDKKEAQALFSNIRCHTQAYERGTPLILQGTPYNALHIIIGGTCVGEMADDSGKIITIESFPAPYTLASALLFADDNRMPVSVWTKSAVEVLVIDKRDVIGLCNMHEQFLINLFSDVANKFTFISQKMAYLALKSLEDRILFFLSQQTPDSEGYIHLTQRITELSTLLGVERPSLSRALARMEKNGVIRRENRRIKVIGLKQG